MPAPWSDNKGCLEQSGLTWWQTRDFSRRYCSTRAPSITPSLLKKISKYFPKRLELSLRIVLAFPKAEMQKEKKKLLLFIRAIKTTFHNDCALFGWCSLPSKIGLDSRICFSIRCSESSPLTAARYCRISLVLSVFPAPDSPLTEMDQINEQL